MSIREFFLVWAPATVALALTVNLTIRVIGAS